MCQERGGACRLSTSWPAQVCSHACSHDAAWLAEALAPSEPGRPRATRRARAPGAARRRRWRAPRPARRAARLSLPICAVSRCCCLVAAPLAHEPAGPRPVAGFSRVGHRDKQRGPRPSRHTAARRPLPACSVSRCCFLAATPRAARARPHRPSPPKRCCAALLQCCAAALLLRLLRLRLLLLRRRHLVCPGEQQPQIHLAPASVRRL